MKRRKFLSNIALGTLGAAVPAGVAGAILTGPAVTKPKFDYDVWHHNPEHLSKLPGVSIFQTPWHKDNLCQALLDRKFITTTTHSPGDIMIWDDPVRY